MLESARKCSKFARNSCRSARLENARLEFYFSFSKSPNKYQTSSILSLKVFAFCSTIYKCNLAQICIIIHLLIN